MVELMGHFSVGQRSFVNEGLAMGTEQFIRRTGKYRFVNYMKRTLLFSGRIDRDESSSGTGVVCVLVDVNL